MHFSGMNEASVDLKTGGGAGKIGNAHLKWALSRPIVRLLVGHWIRESPCGRFKLFLVVAGQPGVG